MTFSATQKKELGRSILQSEGYTHTPHTHENIILMRDFNIGFKNKEAGFDKLSEMCDTFSLT